MWFDSWSRIRRRRVFTVYCSNGGGGGWWVAPASGLMFGARTPDPGAIATDRRPARKARRSLELLLSSTFGFPFLKGLPLIFTLLPRPTEPSAPRVISRQPQRPPAYLLTRRPPCEDFPFLLFSPVYPQPSPTTAAAPTNCLHTPIHQFPSTPIL